LCENEIEDAGLVKIAEAVGLNIGLRELGI
jgi:hypothetical protein